MKKSVLSFVVIALLFLIPSVYQCEVLSQTSPFTIVQILRALALINTAPEKEKKRIYAKVLNDVKGRGVDFALTKENEVTLRNERATNELIETIRANSPPLPTPQPTPEPTPEPPPPTVPKFAPGASATTGGFAGTIRDKSSGERIPGAKVVFRHRETDTQVAVITDADGGFLKGLLPTGDYEIEVSADGYVSEKKIQALFAMAIYRVEPDPWVLTRKTAATIPRPSGLAVDGTLPKSQQKSEPKPEQTPAGTTVKNSLGMELVYVPSGEFVLGSESGGPDEIPVHRVAISKGFWMGKFEVTQSQYSVVMGTNPSHVKLCPSCPVETVSWNNAKEFISRLNAKNDGFIYSLPTEAEWEYADRGGTTGDYYGDLDSIAWYDSNSVGKPHEVGKKQPNAFGLYDMSGNVWEWCEDWYGTYPSAAATDPKGSASGDYRVLRGGSWGNRAYNTRSATRVRDLPSFRSSGTGFRILARSK